MKPCINEISVVVKTTDIIESSLLSSGVIEAVHSFTLCLFITLFTIYKLSLNASPYDTLRGRQAS